VLVPYGSQLLGVTSQESDLDLICVAPAFLDRKMHFFKGLYEVLESQPYVTKINKIEASANPIIKLYYKGTFYL
jgi:poly(A) polymerase